MNTKDTSEICQLFQAWRNDDRSLAATVDEIRDWMWEVNQMGIPHFGETASRLKPFRELLSEHFGRERAMLEKLAELYPSASPEVNAFQRQTAMDHQELLARLDHLYQRLQEIDPPFASWSEAMEEVDVFFAAVEQHELLESDRVGMLVPEVNAPRDCFD
jgi:hypothetical protein